MTADKHDPTPWRRSWIFYGRRYIPGHTIERSLLDEATGKNVVEFNTYDMADSNRVRSVYSALPKITNMFLYEYPGGDIMGGYHNEGLLPLSGVQLEIWGYNFAGLPASSDISPPRSSDRDRRHTNTMHLYVSATPGVFSDGDYTVIDRYTTIDLLSAKNPTFKGIEVEYESIPVVDKSKSKTQTNPKTIFYTKKNKLRFRLPYIYENEGCIDIIVANAAGYTTLNTLTNELVCNL
jgi:hypothetical protein